LTTTTYFNATVTSGACSATTTTVATVVINPTSAVGSISGGKWYCSTTNETTLSLTSYTGSIQWQSSTDNSTFSPISGATSASYTVTNLSSTRYYRVVVTSGVCASVTSASTSIDIASASNYSSGTVSAASQTICSGSQPTTLTLSGQAGSVVQWQKATNAVFTTGVENIAITSTTLTGADIGNLAVTTYFRAVVQYESCLPTNSAIATVFVSSLSVAGTVSSNQTICSGSAPSGLSMTGNIVGQVQRWQLSSDTAFTNPTNINNTTTALTGTEIGVLNTTSYIRAVVKNTLCSEVNSNYVTITVNTTPDAGTISSDQSLCYGSQPNDLTVSGYTNTATIAKWQLSNNVNFSNPTDILTSSSTLSGSTIGTLTTTIYVRAQVISGSCFAFTPAVTITVSPTTVGGTLSSSQTICYGTPPANLTLSGKVGTVVNWQKSDDETFTNPTDIVNTTTTLTGANIGNLTATTYFRALVQSGVCSSEYSSTVTISVTPIPANIAGAASSAPTLCINTVLPSITHTTTGATGIGTTTTNYDLPAGVSAVWASDEITISGTPTESGTFNYSIPLTGGCGSIYATGAITVSAINSWLGSTSSAWNVASNWSCGLVPDSNNDIAITTSTPNAPLLNENYTLPSGRTLTISGTGSLTIGSQSKLTIAGTADFGGKSVVMKSDANGTATLGQITGTLSNATNVTVERYIPSGRRATRYLTPGVTTTNYISDNWQLATHITGSRTGCCGFDQTTSGKPSMYTYENTVALGTGWKSVATTNNTRLQAAYGYRIEIRGDRTPSLIFSTPLANMNTAVTLSATGTLKTGEVVLNSSSSPAINNTFNTTTNGSSLIGNPYVSPIDWHTVSKSGISDSYYAWDATMGTSLQRGRHVSYNAVTGYNSNGNSGSSEIGRYIQPGQAFFVKNTTLGTAGTLTFKESDKAGAFSSVFKTTQDLVSKLGLLIYEPNELALGASPIDGVVALFGNDFTNAIDAGDVEKLESAGENLAWLSSNIKLAMLTMASVADNDQLQLKTLRFLDNKSYTFKFEPLNFDAGISAFLIDQFMNTQTQIDLQQNSFITINTGSDVLSYGEDRFKIVFNTSSLSNPEFESKVLLYPNPSTMSSFYLQLPNWSDATKVILHNSLGQQIPVVKEITNGLTRQFKSINPLPTGIYYITITQEGKSVTKKWIVQ
jgi:hypothetical protein